VAIRILLLIRTSVVIEKVKAIAIVYTKSIVARLQGAFDFQHNRTIL
jgi:hypothetical protein